MWSSVCLASFEKVVGKRGFDPPNVVSSWLIVTESEVGHRTFFIEGFLKIGPFGFPSAGDLGSPYHSSP